MDGETRDKKKAERKSRKDERSQRKAERKDKRAEQDDKKPSRLLAKLCKADDAGITKFHGELAASGVSEEQVRKMRDVLVTLNNILGAEKAEAWAPVEDVHAALFDGVSADDSEGDSEAPPAEAASDVAAPNVPARVGSAPAPGPPRKVAGSGNANKDGSPWASGSSQPSAPPAAPPVLDAAAPAPPRQAAPPPPPVSTPPPVPAVVVPPPAAPSFAPRPVSSPSPAVAAAAGIDITAAVPVLAMTMDGSVPPKREPALPFNAAAESVGPEVQHSGTPDADEDLATPDDAAVPKALPFSRKNNSQEKPPELSLEQYASLCAELAVKPTNVDDILSRYRLLATPAKTALDDLWHSRFGAKPELRSRYDQLVASYTQWYQQNA